MILNSLDQLTNRKLIGETESDACYQLTWVHLQNVKKY